MAKIDLSSGAGVVGSVPRGRDEWLSWCWERNQRALETGWRHWLLVREDGGSIRVEALHGDDAAEVWAMMDDRPLIPFKWPDHAIRKNLGIVQWRMQRGMTADVHMIWAVEGRAARRKAWIESEIAKSKAQWEFEAA